MVKYHVKTPHGIVTRTSRRQLEPGRYTHVVVYNGHNGVVGEWEPGKQIPTFHGRADLANGAASQWEDKGRGNAVVYPITEADYTVNTKEVER